MSSHPSGHGTAQGGARAPSALAGPAARAKADRLDALLWLVLPVVLLLAIPIGFVSNDGLGHSKSFAAGDWRLNPNHLLFEPLGAGWQALWSGRGSSREPVDVLKWLSALAGALAAALFRRGVAPRLAATRWEANHATAWLALSSAYLRLWVSDEIHMIQMPFVVAAAWAALRHRERPSVGRALAAGAAVGLAALAFISNLALGAVLAAALALDHLARRRRRGLHSAAGTIGADGSGRAAAAVAGDDAGGGAGAVRVSGEAGPFGAAIAVGLGAALVAGPALFAAWLASPGAPGFLAWLGRYGGGAQPPRVEAAYGLAGSFQESGEAAVRALYGAASALVDLTPLAAAVREGQAPGPWAIAGALAFLAAAAVLLYGLALAWRERSRPAGGGALLVALSFGVAVLGFGFFWNNSDDQFYFQLAPAFGALAARATARRDRGVRVRPLVLGASLAALSWNVADVGARRIFYPRQERMALLEREVRGACLVVYPGFDEPELLLALSRSSRSWRPESSLPSQAPPSSQASRSPAPSRSPRAVERVERLGLTDLAVRFPAEEGLSVLAGTVGRCVRSGGRVVLLDLYDTPPGRNPWKFLRRLGYERAAVLGALEQFPVEAASRRVGPFTVRTAAGPPPAGP